MNQLPSVAIVVLNWNGRVDTLDCIASIDELNYPNYKIIVVDNGSTDDSVRRVVDRFKSAYVIENGENLGFAEGNNVGIRHAISHGAEYVLLINNDTIVASDLIDQLYAAAMAYPEAGVFGAKIYYHSDPDRLWYAGGKWHSEGMYFFHLGKGELDHDGRYAMPKEVDYACGCALFIRTEVIRQIGLLDSEFFLTYEETDWCYRARKYGWKTIFVPDAKLWHKVSVSFGGELTAMHQYFYTRNILLWGERYLRRKDYLRLVCRTVSCVFRAGPGLGGEGGRLQNLYWKWINGINRVRRGSADSDARAQYLGLMDYVSRRFGDCPKEVRELISAQSSLKEDARG